MQKSPLHAAGEALPAPEDDLPLTESVIVSDALWADLARVEALGGCTWLTFAVP
jgi:hypothetical protein